MRALVLVMLLLSGCGGDEGAVRDVMKGYFHASLEGDSAKACSYLTKAVKQAAGEGCDIVPATAPLKGLSDAQKDVVLAAYDEDLEQRKVTVDGDTARAGSSVLRKEDGEWRIETP